MRSPVATGGQAGTIADRRLRFAAKVAACAVPAAFLGWFCRTSNRWWRHNSTRSPTSLDRRSTALEAGGSIFFALRERRFAPRPAPSLYFDFGRRCVFDDSAQKEFGTFEADSKVYNFKSTASRGPVQPRTSRLLWNGWRTADPRGPQRKRASFGGTPA